MPIDKTTVTIFLLLISSAIYAKETRLQCLVNGKEIVLSSGQVSTTPIQNVQADVLIEEAENGNKRISIRGSSEIKTTVLSFPIKPEMTVEDKTDKKQFLITNTFTKGKDIDKDEVRIDRVLSKLYVKSSSSIVETGYGTVTNFSGECTLVKNIPKF